MKAQRWVLCLVLLTACEGELVDGMGDPSPGQDASMPDAPGADGATSDARRPGPGRDGGSDAGSDAPAFDASTDSSTPLPPVGEGALIGGGEDFAFRGYDPSLEVGTGAFDGARNNYYAQMYWGDSNEYPGPSRSLGVPAAAPHVRIAPSSSSDHAQAISRAIADAPSGAVVLLEAGVHELRETIQIHRSDVHLLGEGSERTILREMNDKGSVDHMVRIGSNHFEGRHLVGTGIEGSYALGGHSFRTRESGVDLSPGDMVFLQNKTPDTVARRHLDGGTHMPMNTLALVDRVEGDTVHLVHRIAMNPAMADGDGEFQVHRIDPAHNVTIARLGFEYANVSGLTDEMRSRYDNFDSGCRRAPPLYIQRFNHEVHLYDLSFSTSCSHHIVWERGLEGYAENIRTEGARNRGGGGHGYGLELSDVAYTVVRGFEAIDNRHQVVFSFLGSQSFNIILGLRGNTNSDFHESYNYGNVIELANIAYPTGGMPSFDPRNQCWDIMNNTWVGTELFEGDAGYNYLRAGNSGLRAVVGDPNHTWGYVWEPGPQLHAGDVVVGGRGEEHITFMRNIRFDTHGHRSSFIVREGGGSDTLVDFVPAEARVVLRAGDYGLTSREAVLALVENVEGGSVLRLDDDNEITFEGLSASDLSVDNFEVWPAATFDNYCPSHLHQNHIVD